MLKNSSTKLKIEKMDGRSKDAWRGRLKKLRQEFPEVLSENQIDCERLKKLVGDENVAEGERYQFTWAGKSGAFQEIKRRTTATLKPDRNESVDFDNTQNLFIEGENLEVLRILQKSYYSKVKMIYIDPPYNTGNDFVYNDKFAESRQEYEEKTGDVDKEGRKLRAFRKNTKESGHYHSNWLSMMYPRLYLSRNLLREDRVIFVSIDDNEVHNLRMIMNEIFGEENFVAEIVWHSKYTVANDTRYLSQQHEYIFLYAKQINRVDRKLRLRRTKKMNTRYTNPDSDPRGPWKATPLHAKSGSGDSYKYIFKNGVEWSAPSGRYPRFSKNTLKKLEEDNRITFGKDGKLTPSVKTFLSELGDTRVSGDLWKYKMKWDILIYQMKNLLNY